MLTSNEKLKIIIEYTKLSAQDIANKLDINRSFISQWLNEYSNKFKKIHMYALCSAFNIPEDIFFNPKVDTKEKVIKLLNSTETPNKYIKNKTLLDKFIGKWRLYFYSHLDQNLIELNIDVDEQKTIIIHNNNVKYIGTIEFIYNHALIKTYNLKLTNNILIITFNINRVKDTIFNVSIITKTLISFRYTLAFGIISKDKLSIKEAKYILGLKNENFLLNNPKKRDNIINILYSKDEIFNSAYSENHIFESLVGKWFFYTKKIKSKLEIIIESSSHVKFIKDNLVTSNGQLRVSLKTSIIELNNIKNNISFFIFKSNTDDIKVCCYKSILHSTETNIMGIGLMSKKVLNQDFLNSFFDEEDILLNIDHYHYKLFDLVNNKLLNP